MRGRISISNNQHPMSNFQGERIWDQVKLGAEERVQRAVRGGAGELEGEFAGGGRQAAGSVSSMSPKPRAAMTSHLLLGL